MGGDDSIVGNGNTRLAFYNALGGVIVDLNAGICEIFAFDGTTIAAIDRRLMAGRTGPSVDFAARKPS